MNWSFNRAKFGAIAGGLGVFCALTGSLPLIGMAAAVEAAAQPGGARFATVLRVRGDVAAATSGGQRRLREGDPVFVGERLRATSQGEAVLRTEDAGMVGVRPGTEFVAERFAAEDKPTDGLTVRLLTGSLRVISGWIARTNRAGHTIVTPSATIGIRGTDHEPYVLSAELAAATANKEGTYDKVNRGGTTMQVGENKLDIDPGRVGFVRAPAKETKSGFKERALMTILMPVLLDKVPDFYVAGAFDGELDRYAQTADQEGLRQLEQKRKAPKTAPAAPPAPFVAPATQAAAPAATAVTAPMAAPAAASAAADTTSVGECVPTSIATTWLGQMDRAIARRNASAIIAMFAPDVAIRATVRGNEGKTTSVDISREELARSAIAAMKGLKNYKQRRVWTEGKRPDSATGAVCNRINLRSVVIEHGQQSGKPYRFESLEEYVLELRAGKWLAIKAETTQQ